MTKTLFIIASIATVGLSVSLPQEAKACGALAALGMGQSDFMCESVTGTKMTENNRRALNYCRQNGYNTVESYGDTQYQCKGGVSQWGPQINFN